ncbi:MAG: DUF4345 domain-containing protein [Pseudomonadota bacterium]
MKRYFPRMTLGLAGGLLFFIGASALFNPVDFAAANGVDLAGLPSALSEYRAPGGMLFASAILMLLGSVRARYLKAGLGLAALVYGSYGIARLVGVLFDGPASETLTQAMFVELLIGAICLATVLGVEHLGSEAAMR